MTVLKFGTEGKLVLHNFIADKSGINKTLTPELIGRDSQDRPFQSQYDFIG